MRFTTIQDVIDYITPIFGDYTDDYDIDAIAREVSEYVIDEFWATTDGNEILTHAGFEIIGDDDEFWATAERYER